MPFHFSFVRMGSVKDCGTDAAWRFCHFCRLPTVPSVFKINNLAQGNGLKEHFHLLCMTHYLPRCSSKWKHISPEFLRIHEKKFHFFHADGILSISECTLLSWMQYEFESVTFRWCEKTKKYSNSEKVYSYEAREALGIWEDISLGDILVRENETLMVQRPHWKTA